MTYADSFGYLFRVIRHMSQIVGVFPSLFSEILPDFASIEELTGVGILLEAKSLNAFCAGSRRPGDG